MTRDPKILIADDDRTVTVLLRATLSNLGYEVVVADDGRSAWRLLQQPGGPQLAILDWMMPGMSGVDVCRKVREWHDAPYVYIILLTGMDQLDDLVKGMEAVPTISFENSSLRRNWKCVCVRVSESSTCKASYSQRKRCWRFRQRGMLLRGFGTANNNIGETSPGAGALQARKVSTRSDFGRYRLFQEYQRYLRPRSRRSNIAGDS